MTEEEVKLLETVMSNSSYTSNPYGYNAFVIDTNKPLLENLIKLTDIIAENAKDYAESLANEQLEYYHDGECGCND